MISKNNIKVAFISAPYRSFDGYRRKFGGKHPTNGIRILAGELLENNLASEIRIFDGAFYPSLEELIREIRIFQPDVMGIPGYTDTIPEAITILKNLPEVKIKITGGPYSTACFEELLQHTDIVFLGESEVSIKNFFKKLQEKGLNLGNSNLEDIEGIAFKKDNVVHVNKSIALVHDLDSISIRGWELVGKYISRYKIAHYRHVCGDFVNIMSSRGCDKTCIYCASNLMHGKGIRFRSADHIEEEIALVEKIRKSNNLPSLKSVKFDDDDILARDIDDLEKLFKKLAKRRLTFTGFASIKATEEDKVRLAAECGMKSIFLGIETHEGKRIAIGKGQLTDEEILGKLNLYRRYSIRTSAGYIIGFPQETREDIDKTIENMIKLPVDYPSINILTIHPGTPLWKWRENNLDKYPELLKKPFVSVDYKRWSEEPRGLPCPHPHITKAELMRIKKEAYLKAYLNKDRISRLAEMIDNPWDGKKTLLAVGDYLRPVLKDSGGG